MIWFCEDCERTCDEPDMIEDPMEYDEIAGAMYFPHCPYCGSESMRRVNEYYLEKGEEDDGCDCEEE